MSSVGSGRGSVDCRIAISAHCGASSSGILVKSDFTSNDTSLKSSGICKVLVALMKSSLDCSFRLNLSVSGYSIDVRCLDSWYVGEQQKEIIGRIEKPGLCSLGRPLSFGGRVTEHFSR